MGAEQEKGFFTLTNLFFRFKGIISITLLLILITSIGSIGDSFREGSPAPFFKRMGGQLLNQDSALYVQGKMIERDGGFAVVTNNPGNWWAKVKAFFMVCWKIVLMISAFWFIYVLGFLLYRLGEVFFGKDNKIGVVVFMIALLACAEIVTNFLVVDSSMMEGYEMTTKEKLIPFKGVFQMCKVIPLLTEPIYRAVGYEGVVNQTTNSTTTISEPIQEGTGSQDVVM